MDGRLIALKLYLDELGIKDDIDTVDDRKCIQKAIYLGQVSGVDLGYRFGWYLLGPYSPSLTKDYYSLAESLLSGDEEYTKKSLRENVRAILGNTKPLLKPPKSIKVPLDDWLEILSSLHFLRIVRGLSAPEANEILEKEKPHLTQYLPTAEQQLHKFDLLPKS